MSRGNRWYHTKRVRGPKRSKRYQAKRWQEQIAHACLLQRKQLTLSRRVLVMRGWWTCLTYGHVLPSSTLHARGFHDTQYDYIFRNALQSAKEAFEEKMMKNAMKKLYRTSKDRKPKVTLEGVCWKVCPMLTSVMRNPSPQWTTGWNISTAGNETSHENKKIWENKKNVASQEWRVQSSSEFYNMNDATQLEFSKSAKDVWMNL